MLLFWLSQAAASLRRYELRRYEEDIPLNLWSPTHHSPLVRREYYFFLLGNKASRGAHRFHRSGLVGRAAEGGFFFFIFKKKLKFQKYMSVLKYFKNTPGRRPIER